MDLLFLMDPLEAVNPVTDTTWALMGRAVQRGHRTFVSHPMTLGLEGGTPIALVREARVEKDGFRYLSELAWRPVADFQAAWMRKDPPFDISYVEATWILEQVDRRRCLVINDPAGIRGANEKLYALRFPELCPPTLVTSDRDRLKAFVLEHGEAVLKPLHGAGGDGILFASAKMRGLGALLEVATARGARCEAQAYLPGATKGDKRILLLDGEPLGAVLRVHGEGEERNNLHLGGHAEKCGITEREQEIVARIAPALKRDGLWFVGIDVIDGHLTEVNVTSPTGIQEIERLDGVDLTSRVLTWCEEKAPRA